MRGTRLLTAVVATFATLATYGCSSGAARPPARASLDAPGRTATTSAALTTTTTVTSQATQATQAATAPKPTPTPTASAVMRVTTERCDRLAACKQVGTGRTFGDRDECFNVVGREVVAALPDEECSSGVDADRLAACVSEVQANACDSGVSASSLPACARERLCRSE